MKTGPTTQLTSEERLHLETADSPIVAIAQDQPADINQARAAHEDLELPIGHARVVQAHTLCDRRPVPRRERPRAAAHRRPIDVVARRERGDVAHRLVLVVVGREVRVELARAVRAPHEARGPAPVVAPPPRARDRLGVAVSAVWGKCGVSASASNSPWDGRGR